MEDMVWLAVMGSIAFSATLGISYATTGRCPDVRYLEDQAAQMRIQMDMLAAPTNYKKPARFDNTTLGILKLVSADPKTVREIQASLGQSREHVSRVVTKMYKDGYLERINARPFRYDITGAGTRLLEG